jgi:hypothetical protein
VTAPAYYAAPPGRIRDWWTLLHPPYTAWHLSYVVLGAALAPTVDGTRLLATLLAFFAAVGVAAHALDELHGRPLQTRISSIALVAAAAIGLGIAVGLGVAGINTVGPGLAVFIVVGAFLVLGYNLEWFHGWVHSDAGFAFAWGAFPVLTAYYAQAGRIGVAAIAGAAAAFLLSVMQRTLSTRAREIRRRVAHVDGVARMRDGTATAIDARWVLAPIEQALRATSWGMIALAIALSAARLA